MFKEKLLERWLNGGCGGPYYYRWAGPDKTLLPCIPVVVSLAKIDLWSNGLEDPKAPLAIAWSTTISLDTEDDFPEMIIAGIVYLVDLDKFFYGTFVPTSAMGIESVRFKSCGIFDGNQETLRPRHNPRLLSDPISSQ